MDKEVKAAQQPELLPPGETVGLNDLLQRPDVISAPQSDLGENIELREINEEAWQLLYSILNEIKPLIVEASRLDRESVGESYTLEVPVNRDNGIFFAFELKDDPKQTTTIYLSDFPYEYGGEEPPPGEKIRCHQIKITSRREVAPNTFTCSDLIFRVTPDFKVIEGDPSQAEVLTSRGMYTNNKTFFLGTNTKYHIQYIELMNPETGAKQLSPLVPDAKSAWDVVLNAGSGAQEFLSRILTGKVTAEDFTTIEPAMSLIGDIELIDMARLQEIGRTLANKLSAQAAATLRFEPVELAYLEDLNQNLQSSVVRTIKPDVLAKDRIALETYLAKRAQRLSPFATAPSW